MLAFALAASFVLNMADGGTVKTGIVIEGDDKSKPAFDEASKGADTFESKMKGVGSTLKKVGAIAVGFVALMAAKGITKWFQESTRLASIQQDALHDLGSAFRSMGETDVKAATEHIAAFASELQNMSTIGDEATIKAAALGVRMGLTGDILKNTVQAAADLSATFGTDLNAEMKFLTEASANSAMSLKKYGAEIDTSLTKSEQFASALEQINKQFAGAAAAKAKTYSGAITQLGNAWGDLREEIGMSTTSSMTLRAIIIELTKFITELSGKVKAASADVDLIGDAFEILTVTAQTFVVVGGFVVKMFLGLKTVGAGALWLLTEGFKNVLKMIELMLTPLEKAFDAAVALGILDFNPLTEGLELVGKEADELSDTFKKTMEDSAQSMVNVDSTVEKITDGIGEFRDRVSETASTLTGELAPAVSKVKEEIDGITQTTAAQEAAFRSLEPTIADFYERKAAFAEKDAKFLDAKLEERKASEQAAAESLAATNKQVGLSLAQNMGNAWAAVAMGAMSASEAMKMALIDSAVTAINAYAASGAAAAAFGSAGIPIIGPIIAVAAAALITGLIKGFLADVPKAAYGGLIGGGIPGVDSVNVLTQRGEGILQTGQTKVMMRLANAAESMAHRPESVMGAGGGGGGNSLTLNYAPRMMVADHSAGHKRTVRNISRALKKVPGKAFQRV